MSVVGDSSSAGEYKVSRMLESILYSSNDWAKNAIIGGRSLGCVLLILGSSDRYSSSIAAGIGTASADREEIMNGLPKVRETILVL